MEDVFRRIFASTKAFFGLYIVMNIHTLERIGSCTMFKATNATMAGLGGKVDEH